MTVVLFGGFSPAIAGAETVSGGTVSNSDVPDQLGTYVPDTTIVGNSESTIEVAYNAEDTDASPDDLVIDLQGAYSASTSVSEKSGIVEFTIPVNEIRGGTHQLRAAIRNTATGEQYYPETQRVGTITAETDIAITGVTLDQTSIYKGGNVGITVTLENTADSGTDSTSLGVYTKSSDRSGPGTIKYGQNGALDHVSVDAGATETITLTRSFTWVSGERDIVVNGEPSKQLTVEHPFTVESYDVKTTETTIESEITVEAKVTNKAGFEVTDGIPLYRGWKNDDGIRKGYQIHHGDTSTVGAGNTKTVSATISFERGGTKYVTAGDGHGYTEIDVTNPLEVTDYSIDSTNVQIGEPITVTANVKNPTDSSVTAPIPAFREATWHDDAEKVYLYLDNQDQATISLEAGNTASITFQHTFENEGEKSITFGDQPYTTVVVNNPLEYSFEGISTQIAAPGEDITVTQTVTNPTDSAVPYRLYVGGQIAEGTVDAGQSITEEFTFSYGSDQTGRQRIWIGGADVSREVFITEDTSIQDQSTIKISEVYDVTGVTDEYIYLAGKAENTGDTAGLRVVEVTLDGTVVGTDLVYVEPGESEWAFVRTTAPSTAGEYDAAIGGTELTVDIRNPVVESATIEHVGGTSPEELPNVDASLSSWGTINVQITNRTGRLDLKSLGVDETTELKLTMVVKNYQPRTVVSAGQDLSWSAEPIDGTDKTKVTVTVRPTELNYMQGAPQIENWDTLPESEDRATFGVDTAILLQVDNGESTDFYGQDADVVSGLSISTDAQLFRAPEYYPESSDSPPRLEIALAAPHYTVDGQVNNGFYEAFLPDTLLDEWGVSESDELTAAYSGTDDIEFTVTEVEGGMSVLLDLHYSSGTVEISKKEESTNSGGSTAGSWSPPQNPETTTTTTTIAIEPTTTTETTVTSTTETEVVDTTPETTRMEETTTVSTTESNSSDTPGFGIQAALVAVALCAVLVKRRY